MALLRNKFLKLTKSPLNSTKPFPSHQQYFYCEVYGTSLFLIGEKIQLNENCAFWNKTVKGSFPSKLFVFLITVFGNQHKILSFVENLKKGLIRRKFMNIYYNGRPNLFLTLLYSLLLKINMLKIKLFPIQFVYSF